MSDIPTPEEVLELLAKHPYDRPYQLRTIGHVLSRVWHDGFTQATSTGAVPLSDPYGSDE